MPKSIKKGDGLALWNAIRTSSLTNEEAYEKMGISNGSLYRYFNMERLDEDVKQAAASVLDRTIDDIFGEKYSNQNAELHETGAEIATHKATGSKEKRRIPLVGEVVAGTEMEMNPEPVTYSPEYIDVGDLLRDSEFAFTVYGNSMTPNYPSGSVLGLKRNYDSFIQEGEIYVVQTRSNRIFKRLYYSDDRASILGISDNTMLHEAGTRKGRPYYPDIVIPMEDIIRIFDVTGMIKRTRNSEIMQRGK